jgi:HK97 family phage major capsid protein
MDGALNATATANNFVVVYGDVAAGFTIVDRIGSTMEVLPVYGANGRPTGQRQLFTTFMTGSAVTVPQALRLLDIPTTA